MITWHREPSGRLPGAITAPSGRPHYGYPVPMATREADVTGSRHRPPPRPERDALTWLLLVTLGMAVTGVAVAADARLSVGAAPFVGRWAWRVVPVSVIAV